MSDDAAPAPRSTRASFLRLQRRLAWNGLRSLMRKQRLRFGLIVHLGLFIWIGLLALFIEGFTFLRGLDNNGPISNDITALLFGMFFLSVTMLTIFSSSLLLYGSLFHHPEAWFLLATPARADRVFNYKFRDTLFYAGWPFLLLGTPLLLAYGIVMEASWFFFLMFPFYLLGYLLLPSAIGACLCLLVVTYMARHRKLVLGLLIVLFLLMLLVWIGSAAQGVRSDVLTEMSERWARKVIDHLQPTRSTPPGAWMTEGLLACSQVKGHPLEWWQTWRQTGLLPENFELEAIRDGFYYLLAVWSYGLVGFWLATWLARRLYRRAFDQLAGSGGRRKKMSTSWSDRLVSLLLRYRDQATRTFVLKDWRSFRRDPVQWGQVLLLGSIILLYLLNIQNLPHSQYPLNQRSLIGLMNVGVIGLMMATFTSRFVFPLMSLEGRNFWILGLLPIKRDKLITNKFTYAATFTSTLSLGFVLLSSTQLKLPWSIIFMHLAAILILSLGLSALSVGLGAYLVNVKETNPSKIATGFGGTMNLLISLGFALVIITLAGLPSLVFFADSAMSLSENFQVNIVWYWQMGCLGVMLVMGMLVILIPLRMGIRAFRNMEF